MSKSDTPAMLFRGHVTTIIDVRVQNRTVHCDLELREARTMCFANILREMREDLNAVNLRILALEVIEAGKDQAHGEGLTTSLPDFKPRDASKRCSRLLLVPSRLVWEVESTGSVAKTPTGQKSS
jgi:hypothetical protein